MFKFPLFCFVFLFVFVLPYYVFKHRLNLELCLFTCIFKSIEIQFAKNGSYDLVAFTFQH